MSPRALSPSRLLGLGLLLTALAVGCDDSRPPLLPPAEVLRPDAERSTVSANPTQDVLADGQEASTLTVTVRRAGGEPVGGQPVRLEVTGEGATVTPAEGTTDGSGVLRAALTSTAPGVKTVRVVLPLPGGAVVLGTLPTVSFRAPRPTQLAFSQAALEATAGAPLAGLEVRVQDASGRTVPDATPLVTLALGTSPEGAALEGMLSARAVAGVARFPEVALKKAGTGYTLVASSPQLAAATSPAFDVRPAPPSSLTLQLASPYATAGTAVEVQVALADAFGNRATNYTGTVAFSSTDASATLPAPYAFTEADAGRHTFQGVVLRRAGAMRLTVAEQASGSTLRGTAPLDVLPGAAVRLAFSQQPANQSVRTALALVQVVVRDAFDNRVLEAAPEVTVALRGGTSAPLEGVRTVAPADGVASFTTLSIATEGTGYSLEASATGLAGATSVAFDIIDDVPPAPPALAQGTTTANSLQVEWDAVGDDGLLGTASGYELRYATTNIVTDADFAAATRATTGAPQAPGTRERVTLSGLTPSTTYHVALQVTDNVGNARRSATLTASTPNAQVTQLVFAQQPADGTAGTALADIRVELRDASGNVVTSASSAVTLTLTQDGANTRTVSAVAGVATFSGVRVDRAGTGYTFDATSGGLPAVRSTAFSISPAPASMLDMVGLVAPVTAGVSSSVQLTLYDAYGNVATGYRGQVRFSSTDTTATLPGLYSFTGADAGQKSFSLTFNKSGEQTLTVVDTAAPTLTDSLTVDVGSGTADRLEVTGLPASVAAGSAQQLTVTARDSLGNIVTGYQGTVRLTSTDSQATLPGPYTFTGADAGQKSLSLTLRTAGAQTATATDTLVASLTGSASTTVEPGPAVRLEQQAPGTSTAGQSFFFTVTARDTYGNRATGYRGRVSFTSSDVDALLPGETDFFAADDGRKTLSAELRRAGTQSLTVADLFNNPLTDTDLVEVSPAAPAQLVFAQQPADGTAGTALADIRVELRDASGNVVTSASSAVTLTLTQDGANTRTVSAVAGVATFSGVRVDRAGTGYTFDATSGGLPAVRSTAFSISPAPVSTLDMVGLVAPVTAGDSHDVRLTLYDAYGNVVTGYQGTVRLTSTDSQATLPGPYTFTGTDAGQKTFSVTLRTAGAQTVTATDTLVASLTDSANTTVEPGPAVRLEQQAPGTSTAGQSFVFTVTARDAYGNRATGYRGRVSFTSSDVNALLPAETDFFAADDGRKTFSAELRRAGTQDVTVTDLSNTILTDTDLVDVSPAAPTRLTFTLQPASGARVRTLLSEVRVALRDAYGNPTLVSSPDVTLALNGNAAATLGGTTTRSPASGVASFMDLTVDQEGASYTLTATAPGLTQATSDAFEVIDDVAPASPSLSATAASTTQETVSWTAVGDDGTQGTATSYELRYATTPLDAGSFINGTLVTTSMPKPAGGSESVAVSGLAANTTYHFALRVSDGAANVSGLASASATTLDPCAGVTCTPPAPSCSADRRVASSSTSQCVASGNTASCQDSTQLTTCQTGTLCTSGACLAVTASDQAGNVIITEFSALDGEFIEVMNTTGAPIDVRGWVLRNRAGQQALLRAPTDLDGSAGTAVLLPAGSVLYGVPNPASGTVPSGAGFVYGEPGTAFALADTGDILDLANASGVLEDLVDFRAFVTSRAQPLTASDFVGFAGRSTQVDLSGLGAANNDSASAWCVSFHPQAGPRSQVADTRGAPNGSCARLVINEVLIDADGADDGKAFIELAGPGGARVGGVQLLDIEGKGGSAGALNADGQAGPGETDGIIVLPPGTRIPANGLLILADGLPDGTTLVPSVAAGVDVIAFDADLENGGGDALQLLSAEGALLDVLGHDGSGVDLDAIMAFNGLSTFEFATALTPSVGASLARSDASTDTDHNRNDFHADPTPTPGQPNGTVSVTVTGLSPTNTLASTTATTPNVLISGTDFGVGSTVTFGGTAASCAVTSSTLLTCTAPARATVGRVDVTVTSPASIGAPATTFTNGFTYTGALNETNQADEADYCVLQHPPTLGALSGQATENIYGQIYEAGFTDVIMGQALGITAELGYGPLNTSPLNDTAWRFSSTRFQSESGNNDEYVGTLLAPVVSTQTQFSYTYRFTFDGGLNWTYCDKNGAGSNSGLLFEPTELGVMTVNP